jgi:hypothetical protein
LLKIGGVDLCYSPTRPGFFNTDLGAFKKSSIKERLQIEFRAGFGNILSARGPRIGQSVLF